jgi:putative glutamine amidotransferase
MDARRQAFELALLEALDTARDNALGATGDRPVLGICLGMQLMALHNGGSLDQFLPDTLGESATAHQNDLTHPLIVAVNDSALGVPAGTTSWQVTSSHRQAVRDVGRLRELARAPDGTLEAIDAQDRLFYVGVQWHPERTEPNQDNPLGWGLIARLVKTAAC